MRCSCSATLSPPLCIHGAYLCPGVWRLVWRTSHWSLVLLSPASLLCFQLVVFLNVPHSMSPVTRNTFYSDSDFLFVLKVCCPSSHADVGLLSFLIPFTFQVWLYSRNFFLIPTISVHFSCSYLLFSLFLSFLSFLTQCFWELPFTCWMKFKLIDLVYEVFYVPVLVYLSLLTCFLSPIVPYS